MRCRTQNESDTNRTSCSARADQQHHAALGQINSLVLDSDSRVTCLCPQAQAPTAATWSNWTTWARGTGTWTTPNRYTHIHHGQRQTGTHAHTHTHTHTHTPYTTPNRYAHTHTHTHTHHVQPQTGTHTHTHTTATTTTTTTTTTKISSFKIKHCQCGVVYHDRVVTPSSDPAFSTTRPRSPLARLTPGGATAAGDREHGVGRVRGRRAARVPAQRLRSAAGRELAQPGAPAVSAHTHTHTQACTHAQTCTHTHTDTDRHMPTRTHTHTHIHTRDVSVQPAVPSEHLPHTHARIVRRHAHRASLHARDARTHTSGPRRRSIVWYFPLTRLDVT